jgi:hypothetical protein
MSAPEDTTEEYETEQIYKNSIKEGYRGLAGAVLGTAVSEAFLYLGGIDGDPPLIFALIGLVFGMRHMLQIRQAKQRLKEISAQKD